MIDGFHGGIRLSDELAPRTGAGGHAGAVVARLGCRSPLVLTDQLLLSLGVVEPVLDSLREPASTTRSVTP